MCYRQNYLARRWIPNENLQLNVNFLSTLRLMKQWTVIKLALVRPHFVPFLKEWTNYLILQAAIEYYLC
jgi:hypothetical protein